MRSPLLPHLFHAIADTGRRALRFTVTLAVLLGLTISVAAQEYTKNQPDQALKTDARVDPSTLGMSLGVPLGGAPGRAGMSLPVSLRYSSKLWRMESGPPFTNTGSSSSRTWAYARYSENSTAGWSSSLEPPRIEFTGEEQEFSGSGQALGPGIEAYLGYEYYIQRIHLHMPDGSTHELRKSDEPQEINPTNPNRDFTGKFYAVDGSRTYYDADAGVLYLPDGSRYLFGARQSRMRYGHAQEGQWGTTYVDRHGNTITYNMSTGVWTDTLGRSFSNPLFDDPEAGDIQSYRVPGVNGHDLIYKLYWKSLGDVLRVSTAPHYVSNIRCVSPTTNQTISPNLFTSGGNNVYICTPTDSSGSPVAFNPVVLAEIELPNGQSYEFKYNVHGEIELIIGPGGGHERFAYAQVATLGRTFTPHGQANRGVIKHWIGPTSAGAEEESPHWQYSVTKSAGLVTATTTGPDGTRSERLIYATYGTNYGYENPLAGMSYDERVYNASSQMLRRTLTGWATITPSGSTRPRDPHVTKTVSLILEPGGNALAAVAEMHYDGDLNVDWTKKYDYGNTLSASTAETIAIGSIPNGALLRTDETTYLVNDTNIPTATRDAYRERNLVGSPSSTRIKNAANTIVARSEVKYDEAAYPLLPSYGAVTGWADPGTSVRGNATTMRSWLDTASAWVETHARYDQLGNVRYAWDAIGNRSEVEYAPAYHYAYPTHTISAVPDPTNTRATDTPLESWTAYDFTTGKVTSTTDANSQVTHFRYAIGNTYDPLHRLRRVEYPDGGWVEYVYNDTPGNLYVYTVTAMNASQSVASYQFFDGLGRSVRSFVNEGGSPVKFITSDTEYDALGRVWRVSNSYRTNGSLDPVNPSGLWTMTDYDALGRVSTVTTPDNAVVSTSYSGNEVTVTDQAGKRRKSATDALGRLKTVYEDPHAPGYTGLNYQTNYHYDVLGNLRQVEQGGQLRFFMYDSLGRLIRAKNLEQGNFTSDTDFPALLDVTSGASNNEWSTGYTYDANGNLSKRRDARNITTTHYYDNLNRLTQTTYTDATPSTLRTYDKAPTNGRGRAYSDEELSAAGTKNYVTAYDQMGRPSAGKAEFYSGGAWQTPYTYARTYDLMGHVTEQTYPSGHKVYYSGFDAAGRLQHFDGNLGDGTQRTYATNIIYDEASRLSREQFGTQTTLYHKQRYNVRGQLSDVRLGLGSDLWSTERGAITTDYGTTANNGNVVSQQHWIPTDETATTWDVRQTNYAYDNLNRVTGMQEYYGPTGVVAQQWYTYDRWGNRQINAAATSDTLNEKQFEMGEAASTNRLLAPGDLARAERARWMRYDDAGNLIEDIYTGAGMRVYDAENRMTNAAVPGTGNYTSAYTYDANGRRVRRQSPAEHMWQVYGFDGELLAEYAAGAASSTPQKEYGYRNGELLITAQGATATAAVNMAAAAQGATASSSSNYPYGIYHATATIDGDRKGVNWGAGGGWNDGTPDSYPDWVQVDFNGQQTISEIDVFTTQDNYANPSEPTETQTFTLYGLRAYEVQYWMGTTWASVPGASVVGNDKVWRKFTFAPLMTQKIRIWMSAGLASYSRVTEVEAWSVPQGADTDRVQWLVSDHLGTPRMIADISGSLARIERHDYLPFGEELYAGVGGRATSKGYSVDDGLRQGFTGYEKDGETGLSFAQARYFASLQGRFTSIDPLLASARVINPQTWNRYAYVMNNPLRFVDPSGMRACNDASCSGTEDEETNRAQADMDYETRLQHQYNAINATRAAQEGDWDTLFELMQNDPTLGTSQFVVANVDELEKQVIAGALPGYLDSAGLAQCARLPLAWQNDQEDKITELAFRNNRLSENWIMGSALTYGMDLTKGTVVATFNRTNKKYAQTDSGDGGNNHTAIFLGWTMQGSEKGMRVIQQMSDRRGKPNIGFIPFNDANKYYRNAGAFNVVRIRNPYYDVYNRRYKE